MKTEGIAKVAVTADRWAPVWSVGLQCDFPLPAAFDHSDVNDRSQEAIDDFLGAAWSRQDAIAIVGIC